MHAFRTFAAIVVLLGTGAAEAQETVHLGSATQREAWRGESAGSEAAISLHRGEVSSADTRPDLIVGAPGWDSDKGRVYVLFGGRPVRGGVHSLEAADAILNGGAPGDRFGHATATGFVRSREVEGGTRDLVVGAPGAFGNRGAVYLFSGGVTTGQRGIQVLGGGPVGGRLGESLATADLDGDGYQEIVVGAPGMGAVFVILGGPNVGSIDIAQPRKSFTYFRIQGSAAAGIGEVLAAGDLFGHDTPAQPSTSDDLVIGAPRDGATGAVYVIRGRASNTFSGVLFLPQEADARFGGIDVGDLAGTTLEVASLDEDAIADLIIGAPRASGPGNSRTWAGEIYVIWGSASLSSRSLSAADVTIFGAAAGHQEGSDLAIGDVNRRLPHDLVSLAAGAENGELHVLLGRARSAFPATIDLATFAVDRRLIGDPARGPITSTLLYDLTGEGFDDVVAGMPTDGEGLVYVSYSIGAAITKHPTNVTVNRQGVVTFTAAASGAPPPSVQWQVSTNNGTSWEFIPGATSSTFSFIAAAEHSDNLYRAVFANSSGTATSGAAYLFVRPIAQLAQRGDYDGDTIADLAIWRPSTGVWHLASSRPNTSHPPYAWGVESDRPMPGDYDGDGINDLAIYRPSTGEWFIRLSTTGYDSYWRYVWGLQDDVPVAADFDGDGRTEITVWRPSTGGWFILLSSAQYASYWVYNWGLPDDTPIAADFDGDQRAEIGVYRPSTGEWFLRWSTTNYQSHGYSVFGASGDTPLVGDFDGDGRADITVWRPSTGRWYVRWSSTNWGPFGEYQFGVSGDVPMAVDFDGDGRANLAVWRPSTGEWFWVRSFDGVIVVQAWGEPGDIPVTAIR